MNYVQCFLYPDLLLTKTEDMSKWETSYHGTVVPAVTSILQHGEMLMEGDVKWDGNYLESRMTKAAGQKSEIYNYPTIEGGDNRCSIASFDHGETKFKIVLQLRQLSGSYEKRRTRWGHEMWATARRGTIMIEAINVRVLAARGIALPDPVLPIPHNEYVMSFACPIQQSAFEFLETLNIPKDMFNGEHNRCYCESCYLKQWADYLEIAGEKYVIPRGWTRFALEVNPVFAKINDIWDAWNIAFHGCRPKNVLSILKHRSLLIPNDILSNGDKLGVCASRDRNQKNYFLSPSIGYSAHPWYARPVSYKSAAGLTRYAQTILVLKVCRAIIIEELKCPSQGQSVER